MKKRFGLLLFLAGAAMSGCGGGGGGSSPIVLTNYRVQGSDSHFSLTTAVPLTVLMPGDTITMAIVGTDPNGKTVSVTGANWTTTAPSSVATLSSSGTLSVASADSTLYTVSAQYNNQTYTTSFEVVPSALRVYGVVRTTSTPVSGAAVSFFDASGNNVGALTSSSTGVFVGTVPVSATKLGADFTGSTVYFNQYGYGSFDYTESVSGCRPKLPTASSTNWVFLPNDIVTYPKYGGSAPPPPPATGCTYG